MNRILNFLLLSFFCVSLSLAQNQGQSARPSFQKFLEEKTNFVIAEMQLPEASVAQFRQVYGEMLKEKGGIMHRYDAVHKVLGKYRKGEQITEQEYLDAVRADSQRSIEDAQLEARYRKKFEEFLTPEQLFRYMLAEQHFQSQFMNRHGNRQGGGEHRGKGPQGAH